MRTPWMCGLVEVVEHELRAAESDSTPGIPSTPMTIT